MGLIPSVFVFNLVMNVASAFYAYFYLVLLVGTQQCDGHRCGFDDVSPNVYDHDVHCLSLMGDSLFAMGLSCSLQKKHSFGRHIHAWLLLPFDQHLGSEMVRRRQK